VAPDYSTREGFRGILGMLCAPDLSYVQWSGAPNYSTRVHILVRFGA